MEDSSHYMPLKIINQSSLPEKSHTNKKLLGTGPKLKRRGKTKKKKQKKKLQIKVGRIKEREYLI